MAPQGNPQEYQFKNFYLLLNKPLNIKQKIFSGTFWLAGGRLITAILRFGAMLILARLLQPEFFGLLSLSIVIMLILQDVSDMGFGAALVQREHIDETDLATIFWFNLAVSFLLTAILYTSAGILAGIVGDARLKPILRALAILLPINALSIVPQAMLRRNLQFALIAWRDVAGMVGFGLVGISLAMLEMTVWSLVGALAAQWVFRVALICLASPYRPEFRFDLSRLRSLSSFSSWMFVSTLMGRLMDHVDYFIIGRFFGATALGYYTIAFQLVIIPIQRIVGVLNMVLFPSFSKIQNDTIRLKNGFLQALKFLTLVLIPISSFVFITADTLIPFLYSYKWLPSVPVVRLLALASFFYGLDITTSFLDAVGKPNWRFIVLSFRVTIFILMSSTWGLSHGIEGVAVSILVAVVLSTILQIFVMVREMQINTLVIFRSLYLPIICTLPASLLTEWLKNTLTNFSDFFIVTTLAIVFGMFYLIAVILLMGRNDSLRILSSFWNRRKESPYVIKEIDT
jgi:O-antigen/teichoic acid export membrane protein